MPSNTVTPLIYSDQLCFLTYPLFPSCALSLSLSSIRMAMGSNVAFALRSILRKDLPKDFKVSE